MGKNTIIESTIIEAKNRFRTSLEGFWPAYNSNGFAERNITFQFAHAFANRPCSCAFMEVPLFNKESNNYNLHIDAYVFDREIGIFIESKRLYNAENAVAILNDIHRMNTTNLNGILDELHQNKLPNFIYALVLAESWSNSINQWWVNGESEKIKWDDTDFPEDMTYGLCEVEKWDNSALSWLYGYQRLKL